MSLKMFQPKSSSGLSRVKNIIAVAAGKGGVGKSTVSVNMALALKKRGRSVGIMDTDIYGPSVRKMLPEEEMPTQEGEMIFPALCQGIPMISMAYFRRDFEATIVRAPIALGIVTQFIKNVQWGDLDYLIIDFPPGTGDIQLTLAQQANLSGAVIVTTPQEVALLDVRKAASLFDQVKVPIMGVVENMSYYLCPETQLKRYLFGKGGGERLSQELGIPLLGSVPIDPALCLCGDLGRSIFEENPDSLAALSFFQMADLIMENQKEEKGNLSASGFNLEWKEI